MNGEADLQVSIFFSLSISPFPLNFFVSCQIKKKKGREGKKEGEKDGGSEEGRKEGKR